MLDNKLRLQIRSKQQKYLLINAEVETLKEIDGENKRRALNENCFITEDEGKRITDPSSDFLMSEADFKNYCKLVFEENKKAGLDVTDYNIVACWKKEQELKKIENELLNLQLETVPAELRENLKKAWNNWKYRQEALDLILRLEV